jgi:hypothetical protein
MSIVALKRKTAHTHKTHSTQGRPFSLSGTHRNQGYVGQTSLSRTILRTPAYGPELQGHGLKKGAYPNTPLCISSIHTTENSQVVKPSVLSYKGMIQKRTQWARRPQPYSSTKPSNSIMLNTSGDYLIFKRKKALEECDAPGYKSPDHCCTPYVKKDKEVHAAISQGEYMLTLLNDCTNLDISYIQQTNTSSLRPIPTCGGV